jgi:hypothetical protein
MGHKCFKPLFFSGLQKAARIPALRFPSDYLYLIFNYLPINKMPKVTLCHDLVRKVTRMFNFSPDKKLLCAHIIVMLGQLFIGKKESYKEFRKINNISQMYSYFRKGNVRFGEVHKICQLQKIKMKIVHMLTKHFLPFKMTLKWKILSYPLSVNF